MDETSSSIIIIIQFISGSSLFSSLVQRSLLIFCFHPFSTTYIFFSKNHQSLIPHLWNQLPVSFRQPCTKHPADDVTLSNSPPTYSRTMHSHPPSHIHCSIPGSKLTFTANLFHHSLLAPTWTAFSDYTGPDLLCSMVFHF